MHLEWVMRPLRSAAAKEILMPTIQPAKHFSNFVHLIDPDTKQTVLVVQNSDKPAYKHLSVGEIEKLAGPHDHAFVISLPCRLGPVTYNEVAYGVRKLNAFLGGRAGTGNYQLLITEANLSEDEFGTIRFG
jgi:hypothetical protein